MMALALAPDTVSIITQFLRPTVNGRIVPSAAYPNIRITKELLIRIFSRKALLQATSWEKDAHKIPGQTYNYVIKLKEVA